MIAQRHKIDRWHIQEDHVVTRSTASICASARPALSTRAPRLPAAGKLGSRPRSINFYQADLSQLRGAFVCSASSGPEVAKLVVILRSVTLPHPASAVASLSMGVGGAQDPLLMESFP